MSEFHGDNIDTIVWILKPRPGSDGVFLFFFFFNARMFPDPTDYLLNIRYHDKNTIFCRFQPRAVWKRENNKIS